MTTKPKIRVGIVVPHIFIHQDILPGVTAVASLRWQSSTWSDFASVAGAPRVTQQDYALVDLMARYDITPQLSATLNAYNLLDKTYQTSSSSAYYGEPRSFRLSLAYRF